MRAADCFQSFAPGYGVRRVKEWFKIKKATLVGA